MMKAEACRECHGRPAKTPERPHDDLVLPSFGGGSAPQTLSPPSLGQFSDAGWDARRVSAACFRSS